MSVRKKFLILLLVGSVFNSTPLVMTSSGST